MFKRIGFAMFFRTKLLSIVILVLFTGQLLAAITPEQRAKIKEMTTQTTEAGKFFTSGEYVKCAEKVAAVQKDFLELVKSKDKDVLKAARSVYSRLQRAHGLLELEGAELEALPSWKDITTGKVTPDEPAVKPVSFKDDIAPWFISACGNCHINSQRGQFSMASYADLAKGVRGAKVVYAGDAKGSMLVEVIESGDMPRGGAKVKPEQLEALKTWIAQGAKFDGPDPTANLNTYAKRDGAEMEAPRPRATAKKPNGTETVSFSRDVAPILMDNCKGCHIGGMRASGNLRLDSFTQLLRGGDSGELFSGSNVNKSLLLQRLKGEGEGRRMPAGQPALSDEQISLISTWIREGAAFDGDSPETNIETVVNTGWAETATHEELFERRKERSLAKWSKVLPNDSPEMANSDEVVVLGNVPPSRVEAVLNRATNAVKQTKKLLRAPSRDPLVKGGITIFVLKSRYDYGEFGKMTENRELPQEWLGHWMADPLDVYAVLSAGEELEEKQAEALVLQVVAGAYIGGFKAVPTWFAEGVARNLVATTYKRGDDRVSGWQSAIPIAMQKVDSARSLLDDRLDEEAAGLVGMALTNFMMNNRQRFDRLIKLLREGRSFNDAATFSFAPPEALVKTWLGKK